MERRFRAEGTPKERIARLNRSVHLDPLQLKTYLERLLADWPTEFPAAAY